MIDPTDYGISADKWPSVQKYWGSHTMRETAEHFKIDREQLFRMQEGLPPIGGEPTAHEVNNHG